MNAGLLRLDPSVRLEQICDIEAMQKIGRERGQYRPDRAKSYVTAPPQHAGHVLRAPGAAFRSNGRWYALSFTCGASSDHLQVVTFDYRIGDEIPKDRWSELGLWR